MNSLSIKIPSEFTIMAFNQESVLNKGKAVIFSPVIFLKKLLTPKFKAIDYRNNRYN
jgi:hypothetical protein